MKNTITILLSLVAVFTGFSQGVEKGKGRWRSMDVEQKSSSNANWMKQRLGLTDEQTAKVKTSNLAFYTSVKEAKTKYKGDSLKTQRKAAIKAANDKREAELKTILTTDQYTKLVQIRKERKEKSKSKSESKPKSGKGKSEPKVKTEDKSKSGENDADDGEDVEEDDGK